ncbi:LysR substrate-binding domain-containing protein, partial [Pseudomonas aeruginosa]
TFSDPGLLLESATQGLGIALVSQLLAAPARAARQLVALCEQNARGPEWAWLVHRDSERNSLTRALCQWLEETHWRCIAHSSCTGRITLTPGARRNRPVAG